ncbi:MAG: hypothetical protein IJ675_04775 [Pseudobutyrivibrio sp.]|nr:hypothetical protein [Pseudobutyrivibrio sp.]
MKLMKRLLTTTLITGLLLCTSCIAFAKENTYTVDVSRYYRSPLDDSIEDSGGESQYALGQSMVDSVVDTKGVIEQLDDGGYALYVRFNLMDNISNVSFQVANEGDDAWTAATHEISGSTDETTDFYIPLLSEKSYVRAECYVEPMGRSVIFYLGYANMEAGNSTDIALYEGSKTSSDATTGLTIGTSTNADNSTASDTDKGTASALGVIDDSIWLVLFGVVFTAVFLAGLLLILVCILVRKIQFGHAEIREKNLKKLDRYVREDTDDEIFDFV